MTEAGLRTLLHYTARTTFVLFVCAFAGNALSNLWPGRFSHWLARRRDWFLLAAAASHTFHLAAIVGFFQVVGWSKLSMLRVAPGGFVYLLIYGLAVVAILRLRGRTQTFFLGPKFEAFTMDTIWMVFASAFIPRIVSGWPVYSLFGVAALVAFVLRIACLLLHRRALAASALAPPVSPPSARGRGPVRPAPPFVVLP